jgi:uncharacterized membrane protein
MLIMILLVLFYLSAPVLLIYLCKISSFLNRVGAVVLAYALGLIAGNVGIIPSPGMEFRKLLGGEPSFSKTEILDFIQSGHLTQHDLLINQVANLQNLLMTIIIPIAIPLLLFSLDLRKWMKLAKGALLSLVLAMISLLASVFIGYYLFADNITESWKVTGMLIGVYTGGTPNLAAIGTALNVSPNIFILTHTYDLIIGSIALLFLMTIAQRLFHTFLPKFGLVHKAENVLQLAEQTNDMENFDSLFQKKGFPDLLKALGITLLIFAVGGGISLLFPKPNDTIVAILLITSLGLAASLLKPVNKLKSSFPLGMYFVIVFSLVVSSMANLQYMFQIEFLQLFLYVLLVVFGSMAIHVGLSRIFGVDADTTIIAITALTYSPPFVPAVASALKNKEVIISGLTIGILGYAFGTYLGIIVATILK